MFPRLLVLCISVPFVVLGISCGGGSTGNSPPPPPGSQTLALSTVVTGLSSPVDLQTPDDGSGRMFVVEQPGVIRIMENGSLNATPFLDISNLVDFDGEKGLLGVAFHPDFSQHPFFYLNYDRPVGSGTETVIARYQVSASDPNQADPGSEQILLVISQPFPNHKGGQLVFGPDGFLYIGLGDGGSGGDPLGNGQSLQTLLGKMLRIDVDHTSGGLPYAIPPDNPFASGGGLPEIFAYGFRNPWRFSFDSATGRLFIGDVGQDNYEEVDIGENGGNFGWNVMEGMHCYKPPTGCNMAGLIQPIAEYDHSVGIAVIGGYVYHGSAISSLQGTYLLSDYGSGTIWGLTEDQSGNWTRTELLATNTNVSSFGQDASGEIYVVEYSGTVAKLVMQ
jgi:glucose/arabinose dehydrogenase